MRSGGLIVILRSSNSRTEDAAPASIEPTLVTIALAGCPNRCAHCWCDGGIVRDREAMPFEAVSGVLDDLKMYSPERFAVNFLEEPTYYPDIVRVIGIVNNHAESFAPFLFMSTNGWGIARDAALARRLKQAGIRTVAFTVYGEEAVHDGFARRSGAFADIMAAASHCREAGVRVTWSLLLHRESVGAVASLANMCAASEESWIGAVMRPSVRCPEGSPLLLTADDLDALPDEVKRRTPVMNVPITVCTACYSSPPILVDGSGRCFLSGLYHLDLSCDRRLLFLGALRSSHIRTILERRKQLPFQIVSAETSHESMIDSMFASPYERHSARCGLHRRRLREYTEKHAKRIEASPWWDEWFA